MNDERMKQAVFTGPGELDFVEIDIPQLKENQVLVKIKGCAICTVEQRLWQGTGSMPYPTVGGHEAAGEVVAIGDKVRLEFEVGDRVVLGVGSDGGVDYYSRRGRTLDSTLGWEVYREYVEQYGGMSGMWGFGEYRVLNEGELFKVENDIPFEELALAEPLSCAIHGMNKMNIQIGDDVVVIGAGPMGLMNIIVAQLRGARVIVSELQPERLERAKQAGAHELINASEVDAIERVKELTSGRGAGFVITAVGGKAVTEQALQMLDKRGELMLFAAAYPAPMLEFDLNKIHHNAYVVRGTAGKDHNDLRVAAKLIDQGVVDLKPVIETTLPFSDLTEALELAIKPETYRVVVKMD